MESNEKFLRNVRSPKGHLKRQLNEMFDDPCGIQSGNQMYFSIRSSEKYVELQLAKKPLKKSSSKKM